MSFKQFGGLNYAAKNNIVGNLYSSSINSGTANIIGLENSKIVSQSHLDMSANSVMHIGSLYFMDGTIQSTAYANSSGTAPTFNDGIIVNKGSQLNGGVTVTGGLTTDTLAVTGTSALHGLVIASNGLTVSNGLIISSGNLTVSLGSTTVQDLNVNGTATINNLTVTGTFTFTSLTIPGNLTVNGTSTLTGSVTASAGLTSTAGITTLGTTTTHDLTASELITASAGLKSIIGATTLGTTTTHDLTASGLITGILGLIIPSGQTLTVNGTSILQTTSTATLTASGLITAGAGLTSTAGATTLSATTATSLNINGAALGSNVLAVKGTTSLQGATSVTSGDLTVSTGNLIISVGNETITAGDLTVSSGTIYANGGNLFSTATSFNLLTGASSPSEINFGPTSGTITIKSGTTSTSSSTGALVVTGGLGIQGPIYTSADFHNLPPSSSTQVTAYFDNVNISGILTLPNTSSFQVGNLIVGGTATIADNLNVGGNTVITGDLTVDGTLNYTNLTVNGTLTVDGISYLNGGISVVHNSVSQFSVDATTGNTIIGPTSGTSATLDIYGPITGHNGLTVSSGSTSLQATTASTLAIGGATLTSGYVLAVSGSTSLQITTTNTLTSSGLITASAGLTIPSGQTLTVSTINPPVSTNLILGNTTANSVTLGAQPTSGTPLAVATVDYVNNRTASTITTTNATSSTPGTTLYPVMTTGATTGLTPYVDTNGFSYDASYNVLNIGGGLVMSNIFVLSQSSAQYQSSPLLTMRGYSIFSSYSSTSDQFVVNYGSGSTVSGITCDYQTVSIASTTLTITASGNSSVINIGGGTCMAGSFTSGSDYRIKEDVTTLNDEFNVDNLRPVTYTNKNTKKQDIGFIAHEVQEEFPYLVSGEKDGEEMQSLNYIGLIGVLVKEIQDLKKRVHMLENK